MKTIAQEYFVRDLVIDDEYDTIDSSATVKEAAIKMKKIGVPDLVVLDQEKNIPIGVIADFDIVKEVVAEGKDPDKEKVIAVMYSIKPVSLDTTVKEAFDRMQKLNVNVVPVIDDKNGQLLGVVTQTDCWGYMPEEDIDEIGMIPVSNPRFAEFLLAGTASILAFIFGLLFPLLGITGYYKGNADAVAKFLNLVTLRSDTVVFYLLEGHSSHYFISYIDMLSVKGGIWYAIVICAFLTIIFGVLGFFSLFYAAYADVKNIRTRPLIKKILPLLAIFFLILQWILMGIAVVGSDLTIDGLGLFLTIASVLLMLLALNRDFIFIQEKNGNNNLNKQEVKK